MSPHRSALPMEIRFGYSQRGGETNKRTFKAIKRYVTGPGTTTEMVLLLTLIPYANSCRTKAKEIAAALGVPFLSVDWKNMTSFDKGGHLDAEGAQKFTKAVLEQLVQTKAFREAVAKRTSVSAPK